MEIKKGTRLEIRHSRKGIFTAVATADFDSEKEEFYPVAVAIGEVDGFQTSGKWQTGENIPCRASFCTFKVLTD